jgi:acetyl esterase/lipase
VFHNQPSFTTQRLSYGPLPLHFADLYLPATAGPHPVVVLIHGGFWRNPYTLTLMDGLAQDLATQGIAAWNIEYRRVGDEGGGWPGTMQDVAAATDHLRALAATYQLDLQRVVSVGHSAGGHLALWLAARFNLPPTHFLTPERETAIKLLSAVSQAGAVDLMQTWQLNLGRGAVAELLGGSPEDVLDRYIAASPAALLPLGIPQVLVHGSQDDRVPLIVSQDYAYKARKAGDEITLIELDGADHFVLIDPTSQAWAQTVVALRRLLHVL